jgi:hypothetical protein
MFPAQQRHVLQEIFINGFAVISSPGKVMRPGLSNGGAGPECSDKMHPG